MQLASTQNNLHAVKFKCERINAALRGLRTNAIIQLKPIIENKLRCSRIPNQTKISTREKRAWEIQLSGLQLSRLFDYILMLCFRFEFPKENERPSHRSSAVSREFRPGNPKNCLADPEESNQMGHEMYGRNATCAFRREKKKYSGGDKRLRTPYGIGGERRHPCREVFQWSEIHCR